MAVWKGETRPAELSPRFFSGQNDGSATLMGREPENRAELARERRAVGDNEPARDLKRSERGIGQPDRIAVHPVCLIDDLAERQFVGDDPRCRWDVRHGQRHRRVGRRQSGGAARQMKRFAASHLDRVAGIQSDRASAGRCRPHIDRTADQPDAWVGSCQIDFENGAECDNFGSAGDDAKGP